MNRDGGFSLSKSWKPLLQKLKREETTIQQKTVIPLAQLLYTPSPPSRGLPIRSNLTRAHFLLVATSDFPLQSNLPNRYIYPVHHVTDILHPPAYEDGTDKEFRNVGY